MSSSVSMVPPRSLIALILGITVVPLVTLVWLGWRLLEQDRILESQQAQQRVERSADLVVAALQRTLSVSEQRLAAAATDWPAGAVTITFRDGRIEVRPIGRVAYLPVVPVLREASGAAFLEGENLEFRTHDFAAAVNFFRELTKSSDPSIRAGALLRLGRNLANTGRLQEATAAYAQLSTIEGVGIGGIPAGLIGRYARCELLDKEKRQTDLRTEAQRLDAELHSGRWALTAPVYWLYAGDVARWTGTRARTPEVFADATAVLWERWHSMPPSGQDSLSIDGETLAVLWQNSGSSFRALIAAPEFVESEWLPAARAIGREQRISFRLGGAGGASAGLRAKRSARDAALPWDLVAVGDASTPDGGFALRRRLLIAGFLLLVSMGFAASYLIFRAVSRELAVARLQSDFVAAVSHEFRTPLTALRQFTDMLREHPGLGEDRRRICYEAQARATDRLMRLVESLLDFGRMEAGARRYQLEPRDGAELVQRVVEDFRSDAQAAGYQIEFRGNGAAQIETDSEALARAVWNLLDNAVKYSPGQHSIEVGLRRREDSVLIDVRDHGIGIPSNERAAIFAKFQRGEQARARGIKGTGIGLAMVSEIVRAHHGRVEVESEPGQGSTFTIVLPAKD